MSKIFFLFILFLTQATIASANESNKNEIYSEIAEKVYESIDDNFDPDSDSKVAIVITDNKSIYHTDAEIQVIVAKVKSGLSKEIQLTSQNQPLDYQIDLSFSDASTASSVNEEQLTLIVAFSIVEKKTGKIAYQGVESVDYIRERFKESYVVRDSLTTVFIGTTIVSGLGSIWALGQSSIDSDKSKEELDPEKKRELEDSSSKLEKASIALAGAAVLTGVLAYVTNPIKDEQSYYSYELVSISNGAAFADGLAFNFKLDF